MPYWVLGGGTALMLYANHRFSRDIDAFIDDPQCLALLSPDTTDAWNCTDWNKAAHYLKLRYPEGEIDFIVSGALTDLDPVEKEIDLTSIRAGWKPTIMVEPPAEIALKKMYHRATMLKPRDIFDITVIKKIDGDSLTTNLSAVASKRDDLLRRVNSVRGFAPKRCIKTQRTRSNSNENAARSTKLNCGSSALNDPAAFVGLKACE